MMPAAQYQTGNQIDYAASLKKDCSWGLFRRIEIDNKDAPEAKISVTLYYDPLTGARIKEGELTGDWRRTYADAVEALKYPGGFYHGVAFLLAHNDPYHLTVVKGGGWAMEEKNYSDQGWALNHMQTQEGTVEILEGQGTYAFHAPFGSDIYDLNQTAGVTLNVMNGNDFGWSAAIQHESGGSAHTFATFGDNAGQVIQAPHETSADDQMIIASEHASGGRAFQYDSTTGEITRIPRYQ